MSIHSVVIQDGCGFEHLLEAYIDSKWNSVRDLHLYVVGDPKVDPNTGLTVPNRIEITGVLTQKQWNKYAEIALQDYHEYWAAKVDEPQDWSDDYSNAGGDR